MDYTREFRKFINSQYLYTGIRITAGVIIPAVLLHHFGLLATMMSVPLGALCVSLTDNPGPPHHRRNGLIASVIINFIVALITGYSHHLPWLVSIEIVVFGLFFTLIGVYGTRVNSIGLIALLVFIFTIDNRSSGNAILLQAAYFSIGGIWYAFLSLVSYTLRPYKLIQQLLGECLIDTARYLQTKAAFYEHTPDYTKDTSELIHYQVLIQQHHADLREMLLKTRSVVKESTRKSRILMMMFLDSIDLFERIMTSQQDYVTLHKEFDDTGILDQYGNMILLLGNELLETGLAVQSGLRVHTGVDANAALQKTTETFQELRKRYLNPDTIEGFIKLRHILYSLQDLTERITRLQSLSTYNDATLLKKVGEEVALDEFVSHQEIDPHLLADNLSLKSGTFRHAIRLVVALLIGYVVSLLFPLGHGYWILLTIVTIIKPAYSITRSRNIHRLAGTLIGGCIGFVTLYFTDNHTFLFIMMLVAMIVSYSFLKLQYLVSAAAITVYVLLSFFFLSPAGYTHVLTERVLDTLIGSVIAFAISSFVLPSWEHEQIMSYMQQALRANRYYFDTVAAVFTGSPLNMTEQRLARKEAFVALANLSDNFQRMLSEPKDKRPRLEHFHQFVALNHMLTSYIASLSYYAQRSAAQYASADFQPLVQQVDLQFRQATELLERKVDVQAVSLQSKHPISGKVQELMIQRRKELESGTVEAGQSVRKTLSDLKTITDQFALISTITVDEIRVLQKILE
ncbi:FUSC family protein [Deminuibacter soli]|uniref:FUSC family protein n=1 Tax=Deminuibacter soli TaxID=2291815 RepID=A0A3E1NLN0_9BACT|nr:FUSC family membrane protein [Deminuibacter soli]RFM28835.1 FUSC family protein [Deminuibacter soli]